MLLSRTTYIALKHILSVLVFPGNRTHVLRIVSNKVYHLNHTLIPTFILIAFSKLYLVFHLRGDQFMHCWGQIKILLMKKSNNGSQLAQLSLFFIVKEWFSVFCGSLVRSYWLWIMPLGIQRRFPLEKQTPKTLHRHSKDILKDQSSFCFLAIGGPV